MKSTVFMVLGVACAPCGLAGPAGEAAVVAKTKAALEAQRDLLNSTLQDAANQTAVLDLEKRLGEIPSRVEGEIQPRREQLQRDFMAEAERVRQLAMQATAANSTEAAALLNETDAALLQMWTTDFSLDALDREQRRRVRDALDAESEPFLLAARSTKRLAKRLERTSHRAMDPLYSMGDAAEDKADGFNDDANEAQDGAEEAAEGPARRIRRDLHEIQDSTEDQLHDAARPREAMARMAQAAADRAAATVAARAALAQELAAAGTASVPLAGAWLVAAGAVAGAASFALATGGRPRRNLGREPLLA